MRGVADIFEGTLCDCATEWEKEERGVGLVVVVFVTIVSLAGLADRTFKVAEVWGSLCYLSLVIVVPLTYICIYKNFFFRLS